MATTKNSIGAALLQIALGLFFIVTGIWTLQNGSQNEIVIAIYKLANGDIANILRIVFGVIEVLAGFFLLLRLFVTISTPLDTVLIFIIMLAWLIAIALIDFLPILHGGFGDILGWLNRLAYHLLVLGAIVIVRS